MRFNLYQDEGNRWRWDFCVVKEKAIASSSVSYDDKKEAIASITLVKRLTRATKVFDKEENQWIEVE